MIKIFNDFINFLNTTFINIDIKENFNETTLEIINMRELEQIREEFFDVDYKFGYSYYVDKKDKVKYYQQLVDYELLPDFIYSTKKYTFKDLKIVPKLKKAYKPKEKYKLGDVVSFNKLYYINLVVPKSKKHKIVKFTKYSIGIPPLKKFGDYYVWKRINFYNNPVKYKPNELFNIDNIPKNINIDQIIDDSNPENKIKAKWLDEYQPFMQYSVGNIITFKNKAYVNLLLKAAIQENPPKNLQSWKEIDIDIPPDKTAYVDPKIIPRIISEDKYTLPASEPKNIREMYKTRLLGDYNPNAEYRLGDIVKFQGIYYVNLLKDYPFHQYKPTESKLQWKGIVLKTGSGDDNVNEVDSDENELGLNSGDGDGNDSDNGAPPPDKDAGDVVNDD